MKQLKKFALSVIHLRGNYKIIILLSTLIFLGEFKIVRGVGGGIVGKILGFPSWEEIWLVIGNLLLFLSAQILRIAGLLFNCVMDYTINFSKLLTDTGVVNIGWDIFRNLSNMVFIFILLTISIATILGSQSYGAKQLLTKVILVALLINFSLFTTKVIIDAANVFTVSFYNATIKNAGVISKSAVGGADYNKGVTAIFAGALNLNTIYKSDDLDTKSKDQFGSTVNAKNIFTVAILGSVLLVIAAFVFFAASILFMKRIVVLMFLMMISPLAFLGMILPATKDYSRQWWDMLFKEAFYAPVFMMFIYVVAKAISTKTFRESISKASQLNGKGFANLATGGDTMLIIFNFILIIGLMLASIITASKLGAAGAEGMEKMGKNLNKWGQGKIKAGAGAATFGAGGRLARKTIGGTSQRAVDVVARSNWARKGGFGSKLSLKTLRGVGDSSFDIRNTKIGEKMGAGTGIKGGYKTKRDKAKKDEIAFAKSLGLKGKELATYGKTRDGKTWRRKKELGTRGVTRAIGSIFSTVLRGSGVVQGKEQAGEALVSEYEKKETLKQVQNKLRSDKNDDLKKLRSDLRELKDYIKDLEKENKSTVTARAESYNLEDEIKKKEADIKEAIEKAKEDYTKAKEKAKVEKAKT